MPAYKDQQGRWYCKFYYVDFTGQRKQKCKRGFSLKREAEAWENDFLHTQAGVPDMTFGAVCESYLAHKKVNLKEKSWYDKRSRLQTWVIPYFKDRRINDITPDHIRQWENMLQQSTNAKGTVLSPGYLQNIVTECSSVFNYATQYFQLRDNPVKKAGNFVGKKQRSMLFWTEEEFLTFIQTFDPTDVYYIAFMTLYYTGLRKGELFALTPADIDLDKGIIHVTKSFLVLDGKEMVTDPKTEESIRDVPIPRFLCDIIRDHEGRIYDLRPQDRIFLISDTRLAAQLDKHIEGTGLKRIRIHDLRHSHASLLIEMGFSAVVISKRLGHKDVTTTLNVYAHLFPNRENEVADKLEENYRRTISSKQVS